MKGFLSRLAARAIGTPAAVEPRLRTRFEPDAPLEAASALEIEEFVEAARAETSDYDLPPQGPASRVKRSGASRVGDVGTGRPLADAMRVQVSRPQPQVLDRSPRTPTFASQQLTGAHTPIPSVVVRGDDVSEPPPVAPPPATAATREGSARLADEAVADQIDVAFARADTEIAPRGSRHAESASSRHPTEEVSAPFEGVTASVTRGAPASRPHHEKVYKPSAVEAAELVAGRRFPTSRTAPLAPDKASEPTVHVRIGRIDVEAVSPRPAVVKSTRPPVESLEDYLKRMSSRR